MELHYGIKQPFRFYETLDHQNRFRKGGDTRVFKLLSPTTHLLPFQIKRNASPLPITSIKYVSTADQSETEVLADLVADQLEIIYFSAHDMIVHYGSSPLGNPIPAGEYYVSVSDGVNTWYSEVISVQDFNTEDLSNNVCVITKITYWDTCDVAGIFYRTDSYGSEQYKNILYLDIDVGKPTYEFTEEGEEDGEGNFSPDYKRLEKQYTLEGVFPEYIVDALSLLPLHVGGTGTIQVLTSRGYTGQVDRITVDPSWEGNLGVWATTNILFNTEFVVKTNCCDSLDTPTTECIRDYETFVAMIVENSADYNNFEYTDASDNATKIPLQNLDLVLVQLTSGEFELKQYTTSSPFYVAPPVITNQGDVYADANILDGSVLLQSTLYYFKTSGTYFSDTPIISTESYDVVSGKRKVTGETFNDCTVNVYVVGPFGQQLVAQVTGTEFNQNGALYDFVSGATGVFIGCVGLTCDLGQSAQYNYPSGGVGTGIIEGTFVVG